MKANEARNEWSVEVMDSLDVFVHVSAKVLPVNNKTRLLFDNAECKTGYKRLN